MAIVLDHFLPLIRDLGVQHHAKYVNSGYSSKKVAVSLIDTVLGTGLPSSWNMDLAFERYREEEHTWWKRHQVDRPREHFVHPSGSLSALIACHLSNPTFAIDNPSAEETNVPSNPSIAQLHDAW